MMDFIVGVVVVLMSGVFVVLVGVMLFSECLWLGVLVFVFVVIFGFVW